MAVHSHAFWIMQCPSHVRKIDGVSLSRSWSVCLLYLDDILVHAKTFEEEIANLREVFGRFRAANLKLNPKKCELFRQKVLYLGHIVTQEGISTEPSKVEAVISWPTPMNKRGLRGFLGLCSYYSKINLSSRLISDVAGRLYKLIEKETVFAWQGRQSALKSEGDRLENEEVRGYMLPYFETLNRYFQVLKAHLIQ